MPPALPAVWLDWTAPVDSEGLQGYNLYLGTDQGQPLGHIELNGPETSQRVWNHTPITWVRVTARYPDYESGPSNEISFTINDK